MKNSLSRTENHLYRATKMGSGVMGPDPVIEAKIPTQVIWAAVMICISQLEFLVSWLMMQELFWGSSKLLFWEYKGSAYSILKFYNPEEKRNGWWTKAMLLSANPVWLTRKYTTHLSFLSLEKCPSPKLSLNGKDIPNVLLTWFWFKMSTNCSCRTYSPFDLWPHIYPWDLAILRLELRNLHLLGSALEPHTRAQSQSSNCSCRNYFPLEFWPHLTLIFLIIKSCFLLSTRFFWQSNYIWVLPQIQSLPLFLSSFFSFPPFHCYTISLLTEHLQYSKCSSKCFITSPLSSEHIEAWKD
jgi:hypothetical protein